MEDYSIIFYWSKSIFLIVSVEVPSQPYMFIFVAFQYRNYTKFVEHNTSYISAYTGIPYF